MTPTGVCIMKDTLVIELNVYLDASGSSEEMVSRLHVILNKAGIDSDMAIDDRFKARELQ